MQERSVSLRTSQEVQRFVGILLPLDGDFELISGKHILDARSLMGIFSLDLSSPVTLRVYKDNATNMEAIRPFLAKGKE